MKEDMGSFHVGGKSDEQRSRVNLDAGDIVSVKQVTHRWSGPPPEAPGGPHIEKASARIDARGGMQFCMLFLGRHPADKPFTLTEIEERLNKLGWFRKV
jgi:hypothetical protein